MNVKARPHGLQIGAVAAAAAAALAMAAPAQAAGFETKDGWSASFDGVLSAFYVNTSNASDSGAGADASESRFMSGFNPSKFNAHFSAPSINGLKIGGNFQFASNISSGSSSGTSAGGGNGGMDVRVLDITLSGDWGSIAVGRSWGIFSGSAIVYDEGSGSGVGHLCGAAGSTGGGTCGRIGAGYTWTAFAARVEYATPDLGGFSARIGLFDPANGSGGQNKSPRLEAEASYGGKFDGGAYKLWLGGLTQSISAPVGGGKSATLSGTDIGVHVDVGGFALAGSYARTRGFGANGFKFGGINLSTGDVTSDTQAYVDASYKVGPTRFGFSSGTGKQDATEHASFAKQKNTLNMLYLHHDLTPQARLSLEYDDWKSDNESSGANLARYKVLAVGLLYNF